MYKFRNSAKKRTKVRRFFQTSALCYAYLTILALTHLVLRVFLVDNEQATLATDDFAVGGAFLQRCSCFHNSFILSIINYQLSIEILFVSKNNSSFGQVVWTHLYLDLVARQDTDIVHPHLTRDVRNNLHAVL